MAPIEHLDIHLVYRDPSRWRWTLQSLTTGTGYLDPADMDATAFFKAGGGIRLFADRFFCFLDTEASGDLFSYVDFLMTGVVGLSQGVISPRLDRYRHGADEAGVVARLHQEDRSQLVLRETGAVVELDFLDGTGEAPQVRGSLHFKHVAIVRSAWWAAARQALVEYVSVVQQRIRDSATPPVVVTEFVDAWNALSH
jgi:hypothetical protein